MQRRTNDAGDNGSMNTITNIADRLFRKVEPVDFAFEGEAAGAAVEGAPERTWPQIGAQTKPQTGAAFPAETRTPAFCAIDCPGRCPLELHLRDGELARVSANKAAPACHRGLSMRAWANSPDRLMWPLRRVGPRGSAQFERVTWDEALDEISDQLARIRREHGNESIYLAYTTGQSCTTADPFERLMNCFGGFLDHYNNYSNPQINAMVRSTYGPGALYPGGSELDAAADAQLVLVFGASPAETGTGRATWHGAWDRVVEQVGERGGRIVMVDPRRNGSIPKRKRPASSGENEGQALAVCAAPASRRQRTQRLCRDIRLQQRVPKQRHIGPANRFLAAYQPWDRRCASSRAPARAGVHAQRAGLGFPARALHRVHRRDAARALARHGAFRDGLPTRHRLRPCGENTCAGSGDHRHPRG